jgi:ribosomal protein S18 acetylase RimI-like enzyme
VAILPTPLLRPAGPGDAAALNAILWATYESTWRPQLSADRDAQLRASGSTARYVQSRLAHFQVAECDGTLAGFVDWEGDFIDALHVLPRWQGRGVGRALLAHAEAAMRTAGRAQARLETDTFNTQALGFYSGQGYAQLATYPDEEWDSGLTTVLMAKALLPGGSLQLP